MPNGQVNRNVPSCLALRHVGKSRPRQAKLDPELISRRRRRGWGMPPPCYHHIYIYIYTRVIILYSLQFRFCYTTTTTTMLHHCCYTITATPLPPLLHHCYYMLLLLLLCICWGRESYESRPFYLLTARSQRRYGPRPDTVYNATHRYNAHMRVRTKE